MSESKGQVDKTINTPSIKLGPRTSHSLLTDPRHIVFLLSHYKFCATIFEGAPLNLELRMALYERSYLNLGSSNGPMVLCILNETTKNCSGSRPRANAVHAATLLLRAGW